VRFVYPEEERLREEQKIQRGAQERERARSGPVSDPKRWNSEYRFAGDESLVPRQVFDDGEATYFRFSDPRDFPAIFVVERVGGEPEEELANYRVEGEFVVVHGVAEQFSLRTDDRLVCIFNERKRAPGMDVAVNAPRERPREGWWSRSGWRLLSWVPGVREAQR